MKNTALIVTLLSVVILVNCSQNTTSLPTDLESSRGIQTNDDQQIEITVWAPAGVPWYHWRVDGPVKAVSQVTGYPIEVIAIGQKVATDSAYFDDLEVAIRSGMAPDIGYAGSGEAYEWVENGSIVPLETCLSRYPEFDDIRDELYASVTWQNQRWAIPFEIWVRPLFFNKPKLRELGWSEPEITALPEKIRLGQFTLEDMLITAQEAIAKGIIAPGYGFWPDPRKRHELLYVYTAYGGHIHDPGENKLVIVPSALEKAYQFQYRLVSESVLLENFIGATHDTWANRAIWRDTIAQGQVLFWTTGSMIWPELATDYVSAQGGETYLFETTGLALHPPAEINRPGGTRTGLHYYVIFSETASGRKHQEAACELLAKTLTPEINALHNIESRQLGVLESPDARMAYLQDRFLAETLYMLEYAQYDPPYNPSYETYRNILLEHMAKAESGELIPAEAASLAVTQLQRELGDILLIEQN